MAVQNYSGLLPTLSTAQYCSDGKSHDSPMSLSSSMYSSSLSPPSSNSSLHEQPQILTQSNASNNSLYHLSTQSNSTSNFNQSNHSYNLLQPQHQQNLNMSQYENNYQNQVQYQTQLQNTSQLNTLNIQQNHNQQFNHDQSQLVNNNHYTALSNSSYNPNEKYFMNASSMLKRNPVYLKELNAQDTYSYDNLQSQKNSNKLNKELTDDDEGDKGTKMYGNAYLGENLWDKNELYQGEKYGIKLEYLEIDEFLNENRLNEADAEFLENLQRQTNNQTITKKNSVNLENNSLNQTPVKCVSGNSSPNLYQNSRVLLKDSQCRSQNVPIKNQHSNNSLLDDNLIQKNSVSAKNQKQKDSNNNTSLNQVRAKISYDWNTNEDLSLNSLSDLDEYDPKYNKKLNIEKAKSQPIFKKSIKDFGNENSSASFTDSDSILSNGLDLDPRKKNRLSGKRSHKFVPNELKDEKYWARRRKNNMAAKRSRDARRLKENQIAITASYLEHENELLRKQLEEYKRETKSLAAKLSRYEAVSNTDTIN